MARRLRLDVEDAGAVRIAAAKLHARPECACLTAIDRCPRVHGDPLTRDSPEARVFVAFVELAERLRAEGRRLRVQLRTYGRRSSFFAST